MGRPFRSAVAFRILPLAAIAALGPAAAGATSYNIATFADDAVVNGNCTLREAIRAANTNLSVDTCAAGGASDTITLPTGTYPFSGGEVLTGGGSLTIRSATLDPLSVSIDLGSSGRFMEFGGSGSYTLWGLEIKNGLAPVAHDTGGAIWALGVGLQIFDCRFKSNHAADSGGALTFYSTEPGASLVIRNAAFLSNSATGTVLNPAAGGAVWASLESGAHADLRDVSFTSNSASDSANSGAQGGGLRLQVIGSGSSGACIRCTFSYNSVVSAFPNHPLDGGAVYAEAYSGGLVTLTDGLFSSNWATSAAAPRKVAVLAGFAASGSTLALERLYIDFNSGPFDAQTSDVRLEAQDAGSLIEFYDSQVTFGDAGGLVAQTDNLGAIRLGHLTVADYPLTAATLSTTGGSLALENSIVVAISGTDLATTGTVLQSTNFVGGNPLFVNAPGGNYRLDAASPAVNAGTNGAPTMRFADLDHHPRIVEGVTDIGCYELPGIFADDFEVGDAGSWSQVVP